MWAYGIHATYHRDTWREVFDIIDNEVRNEA
jgi:hypothetical protein